MFSLAVSVGTRLQAWNTNPTWSRRRTVKLVVGERAQVGAADEGVARREGVEAGDAVEEGRLARPRWAHDGGEPLRSNPTVTPSSARTSVWPFPYTLVAPSVRAAGCASARVRSITDCAMSGSSRWSPAAAVLLGAPARRLGSSLVSWRLSAPASSSFQVANRVERP